MQVTQSSAEQIAFITGEEQRVVNKQSAPQSQCEQSRKKLPVLGPQLK